jgi:hypothetical protein
MNETYRTQVALLIRMMPSIYKIKDFAVHGGTALSRQHPRDLFDCKYMEVGSFDEIKNGLIFCLLGSDKPIIESLHPNPVDHKETLKNQFQGMSDVSFDYTDFEITRKELIEKVNRNLTNTDKEFLISYENGSPDWKKCCAGDLSYYPAIQWKLKNILNLKGTNSLKFNKGIEKLQQFLFDNEEDTDSAK